MDKEIEIKLEITADIYRKLFKRLSVESSSYKQKEQKDIYFSPEAFPFFGGNIDNECLRIRILEDKSILSYKKIFFGKSDEDIHIKEHETEVVDLEQTKKILQSLRINEVLTLHKIRNTFIYKDIFEIALDEVDDLGYFI